MAINFLDNIQLNQNQLLGARLENVTSDPGSALGGDIIFNSTSNILKYYNGSAWISLTADTQGMVSWTLGDGSSTATVSNGEEATFASGTGITTSLGTRTITISNSQPFNGLTLASTSGAASTISDEGTITLAAGAGITTTNNGSGQVTIAATGSGSMSNFTLSGDSGTNQTIADGNTLDIAGGTNISTVVGATDTVTVNLDDSITLAGDLTVTGGDITLGGTGRIQGIDTVTDGTDAANKTYVDNSVVGNLIFQGGYNAATNTPDLDSSPSGSIKKGWSYVVTVAGNFFTEAVEVGDFLIAQQDAPTTLANWVTVQNNVDLATVSTVGIGNTNIEGTGKKDGLSLGYNAGTATLGLDIGSLPAEALNTTCVAAFYDPDDTDTNFKATVPTIAASLNAITSKKLTTTSQTTHTFTHNLNTFDVIVQLYDTSSKETVYANVDRTSVDVVTATTAAAASLTALIQKIG